MSDAINERNERRAIAVAAQERFADTMRDLRRLGVAKCSTNDKELCKLVTVYVSNNRRKFYCETVNGQLVVGRIKETANAV